MNVGRILVQHWVTDTKNYTAAWKTAFYPDINKPDQLKVLSSNKKIGGIIGSGYMLALELNSEHNTWVGY